LFRNYFITAARHILRHRLYSLINILGLAVGVAACLLIFLFVRYETSYDSWMPNADNIYRLNYINFYKNGDDYTCGCAPGIAKAAMDERFSEIEHSTRFYPLAPVIGLKDRSFVETIWMADSNFFSVFELPFLEGDRETAFDNLTNIVISQRMAIKYFGEQSPLGEILTFTLQDEVRDFKITGVFADLPENSEFNFQMLFPLDNELYGDNNAINQRWFNTWGYLYLKLKDGSDASLINSQLSDLVAKNVPTIDERKPEDVIELSLTNLRDIHLYSAEHPSGPLNGIRPLGNITQVYSFAAIAGLILLIACINFMNLSTARSLHRAKEVSMRKTLGASRAQLIRQFLGENILVAAAGLLIALVIVDIALPRFNEVLHISTSGTYWTNPTFLAASVFLLLVIGVVAGLYPAFYLSAFRPAQILSGDIIGGRSGASLFRAGLTIFQFSISIALIIATAVVYSQNVYSLNKDMGFNKENALVVRNLRARYARDYKNVFAEEVSRLPAVESVSQSAVGPADYVGWHTNFRVANKEGAEDHAISPIAVDDAFFHHYEIPILFGRAFDKTRAKDQLSTTDLAEGEVHPQSSAIVNVTAARQLGFSDAEAALGQILQFGDDRLEIVGIVADYHHQSTREPTRAFVYMFTPNRFGVLNIKYAAGADKAQLQRDVAAVWKQFVPDVEMHSVFVTDKIKDLYVAETRQSEMLLAFSLLAILVACLGLYGLAAFTSEQQSRSIAIRKVHGAQVWDVVKMMLLQFSKPVLIANLLAWPVAWYLMADYLSGFTFRIDLNPLFFIATGLMALLIAWLTTGYHALKAARTSPALVLKSE